MVIKINGPIRVVYGRKNGRFPYVNSIMTESKKLTVIDLHLEFQSQKH